MRISAGQVAIVTGAASGIGHALAASLAERGVRVVLSDLDRDALDATGSALAATGAATLAVPADVSVAAEVEALTAATLAEFGRVDLLCNNAGVTGRFAPMWEQSLETWRWMIDVMLLGVVNGVRSVVPHLVAQGSGHVLNTASMGGLIRLPGLTPYNAVKHAVVGLTESLDLELRAVSPALGASVLCPGLVDTNLHATSAAHRPRGVEAPEPGMSTATLAAEGGTPLLSPAQVATAALAGVEADRTHILTNPGSHAVARERLDALLADLTI